MDEQIMADRIMGRTMEAAGVIDRLHKLADQLEAYQNGRGYGHFNFGIKIYQMVDVPDEVIEEHGQTFVDEEAQIHAETLVGSLRDDFKRSYSWIDDVRQEGRMGGWLAIDADYDRVDELRDMDDSYGEGSDMEDLEEETKQILLDLKDIEKAIKATIQGYVKDLESDQFWRGVTASDDSVEGRVASRVSSELTAVSKGPVEEVIDVHWNKVNDLVQELRLVAGDYDMAVSYGGPGERKAKGIWAAVNSAADDLDQMSKSVFSDLVDDERKFTRVHGTPEEYVATRRGEIFPS